MGRTDPGRPQVENGATGRALVALLAAVVVGAAAFTAVAMRRWWLPPVASEHGAAVDRLFTLSWWIIAAVFLIVHGTLIAFIYRFGARAAEPALHWHEDRRLELAWTLIPALVITTLVGMGELVWASMHREAELAQSPDTVVVEVTAEQFGWRVRYPGPDGEFGATDLRLATPDNPLGLKPDDPAGADDVLTQGELRVPVNRPVVVVLRSKDVIHSFFVPSLRLKQDAVPGRTIPVRFTPTRTGVFEIACAELCGVGHWAMRGELRVVSEAEFGQWLDAQLASR